MNNCLSLCLTGCLLWVSPEIFAQTTHATYPASKPDGTPAQGVASLADSNCVLQGQPIKLFDGKSLAGWTRRDGKPSKNWSVEDGALHRSSGGGDLYHQHWFRDFDLTFVWKIQDHGNSGVKYRVQAYGKQMLGCEYQLQDDKDRPFDRQATGSIYAVVEPGKNKSQLASGNWNHSRIVVCGQQVEHWLNGELVVATRIGSLDWLQRVGESKFRDKEFFGQNREGRIFLQDHGNPVWFKEITLTPLDADIWK